ncbi:HNH endonuclease family protein [Corynebacterium sp.]|uniref:HNH endonuclease family protein n=1 Tax=Corynebacterium sp. TaxID=1720 RepID=UPI003B3ADFCD
MRLSRPVSSVPATVVLAVLCLLPVCGLLLSTARTGPAPPAAADRNAVSSALRTLETVPRRTHVLGYSRDQFGGWSRQWWTDDDEHATGPTGAQCSTRHIVLLDSFDGRSPTTGATCPSARGRITDVYTGEMISPDDVEIDHVVPLSAAWDHGAWDWPRQERVAFANDRELNLLAVAGPVNQDKSDGSLGEWLPPTAKAGSLSEAGCAYAARYLAVSVRYALTVSAGDAATAERVCGL